MTVSSKVKPREWERTGVMGLESGGAGGNPDVIRAAESGKATISPDHETAEVAFGTTRHAGFLSLRASAGAEDERGTRSRAKAFAVELVIKVFPHVILLHRI